MAKSLRDIIVPRAGRNVPKGEADFLDIHKVAEKDYPVKQKPSNSPHQSDNSQDNHPSAPKTEEMELNNSCNNTNENVSCPVHGMKECMSEKKNIIKEKGMKEDIEQVNELTGKGKLGAIYMDATKKRREAKDASGKFDPVASKKHSDVANRAIDMIGHKASLDAVRSVLKVNIKSPFKGKKYKKVDENSEVDYEGEMAKSQLKALANKSAQLSMMMHDDQQLEAWVQSKIANAKQMVDGVYDYLMYRDKPETPAKETTGPDSAMQFPAMNIDNNYGAM